MADIYDEAAAKVLMMQASSALPKTQEMERLAVSQNPLPEEMRQRHWRESVEDLDGP